MAKYDVDAVIAAMRYSPETGDLFWVWRKQGEIGANFWNAKYAGRPAITATDNRGYKSGKIGGAYIFGHVAAFIIMNGHAPDGEIDHINGNRADNRWENLRLVSRATNQRNKQMYACNTSGYTGVSFDKKSGKWRAKIGSTVIGFFQDMADAAIARSLSVELEIGYTDRHGKQAAT